MSALKAQNPQLAGWLVSDLAGLTATLSAAGVEVVDDEPLDGYDRAYAYDPFGNRLELLEAL